MVQAVHSTIQEPALPGGTHETFLGQKPWAAHQTPSDLSLVGLNHQEPPHQHVGSFAFSTGFSTGKYHANSFANSFSWAFGAFHHPKGNRWPGNRWQEPMDQQHQKPAMRFSAAAARLLMWLLRGWSCAEATILVHLHLRSDVPPGTVRFVWVTARPVDRTSLLATNLWLGGITLYS